MNEQKSMIPVPVFFAGIWILLRLALHTFQIPNQERIGVYINILLVLLTVFASLNRKIRTEKKLHPYSVNFKHGLKNAAIYIVIIIAYVAIHHKFVNPDYLMNNRIERVEQAAKDYDLYKDSAPELSGISKAEFMAKAEDASAAISSITTLTTLYFLGLFMMAVLSSIFIPIIYKKLILRM